MSETVKHPAHYNNGKIEVIDAIEDWKLGFNDGNAVKYIGRHKHKGKPTEDLKKALWYIARELFVSYEVSECELLTLVSGVKKQRQITRSVEDLNERVGFDLDQLRKSNPELFEPLNPHEIPPAKEVHETHGVQHSVYAGDPLKKHGAEKEIK